ncbi:hypothetical protein XELAEV_18007347mg [Xenopus laevis]|uniref:Uncharacterized protein n=1 Tax=Xenopus laevis TaxID=8355 RepID=A0A974I4M8_XENLA|nr:hypothetical protein XELAEV_18007347mg [Xenopus laevis]
MFLQQIRSVNYRLCCLSLVLVPIMLEFSLLDKPMGLQSFNQSLRGKYASRSADIAANGSVGQVAWRMTLKIVTSRACDRSISGLLLLSGSGFFLWICRTFE